MLTVLPKRRAVDVRGVPSCSFQISYVHCAGAWLVLKVVNKMVGGKPYLKKHQSFQLAASSFFSPDFILHPNTDRSKPRINQ
jgi:hypothetical protein